MNDGQRPWEKSNTLPHKLSSNGNNNSQSVATNNGSTNSGSESPRPSRKRFGSASEETILKQVNGDGGLSIANSHDLETLKAEILREIRLDINKAKQEIIDGKHSTPPRNYYYCIIIHIPLFTTFMALRPASNWNIYLANIKI